MIYLLALSKSEDITLLDKSIRNLNVEILLKIPIAILSLNELIDNYYKLLETNKILVKGIMSMKIAIKRMN